MAAVGLLVVTAAVGLVRAPLHRDAHVAGTGTGTAPRAVGTGTVSAGLGLDAPERLPVNAVSMLDATAETGDMDVQDDGEDAGSQVGSHPSSALVSESGPRSGPGPDDASQALSQQQVDTLYMLLSTLHIVSAQVGVRFVPPAAPN